MVINNKLFEEIIAILTLISINGVIPSLLDFQGHLNQSIVKLSDSLKNDGHSEQSVDALQRLICLVIDITAKKNLAPQGITWEGYKIEHVFYGYGNDILFSRDHAATIFTTENCEIADYAVQLITISSVHFHDRKIQQMYMSTADALLSNEDNVNEQKKEFNSSISPQEIRFEETVDNCSFWPHFLSQISVSMLILIMLWFSCWYLIRGSI